MYSSGPLLDDDLYSQSDFRRQFTQRGRTTDGRDGVEYGAVEIGIIALGILDSRQVGFRSRDRFVQRAKRQKEFFPFTAELLDFDSQKIPISYQIQVLRGQKRVFKRTEGMAAETIGAGYFAFNEADTIAKGQCAHCEPGDFRRNRVSLAKLTDNEPSNDSVGGSLTMPLATLTSAQVPTESKPPFEKMSIISGLRTSIQVGSKEVRSSQSGFGIKTRNAADYR